MPYTYEGCVVKISDKIAYLGRDIEDAYNYKFFDKEDMLTLKQLAQEVMKKKIKFKDDQKENERDNGKIYTALNKE